MSRMLDLGSTDDSVKFRPTPARLTVPKETLSGYYQSVCLQRFGAGLATTVNCWAQHYRSLLAIASLLDLRGQFNAPPTISTLKPDSVCDEKRNYLAP